MSQTIKVWGHRGCRGSINPPENSVVAFETAMNQGADGIELDVFLSKDNQLVVFHDDALERMSDGCGAIVSLTLRQLKQLRLRDSSGQLTDAEIPTLNEVLDAVGRFRGNHPTLDRAQEFTVNIEIKEMAGKDIAAPVAQKISERFAQGWKPGNFQVSSFDLGSLKRVKGINPEIPRGALLHGGQEPWDIRPSQLAEHLALIRDLKPQTVNITLPSITPETVRMIRAAGADLVAWTCNETNPDNLRPEIGRSIAATLIGNHVAAIITDYPKQMLRLLTTFSEPGWRSELKTN